ncbi:MAG: alpha/beta fold hydrolase, partial [Dehalococcoidia bacterium]
GWSDITEWDPQVGPLSEKCRVIRYDRRGCGRSEPKDVTQSPDLWVEDLLHFMDALNLDSAVIGGVSFGGMLLMEFLLKHPQRVKGAIIVSATAGGYEGSPGYEVPFPNRLTELKKVRVPALVIQADGDDIFPPSHGEAIAGAIPNAQLVVLKGGHTVNIDNPEAFNQALLSWLEQLR